MQVYQCYTQRLKRAYSVNTSNIASLKQSSTSLPSIKSCKIGSLKGSINLKYFNFYGFGTNALILSSNSFACLAINSKASFPVRFFNIRVSLLSFSKY